MINTDKKKISRYVNRLLGFLSHGGSNLSIVFDSGVSRDGPA